MSDKWNRNCVHGYREADCEVCGKEPASELATPAGSASAPYVKPCDATCPKCGSADISRQFRHCGERWAVNDRGADRSKHINASDSWYREAVRDIITHRCRTCQFNWATPPLKRKQNK